MALGDFTTPHVFQEKTVPKDTALAGYAALIQAYGLQAPLRVASCVAQQTIRGTVRLVGEWQLFDKRLLPKPSLRDHIFFALRYETLDLLILKRLFLKTSPGTIEAAIRSEPFGIPARMLWFLWEWLLGQKLDLPDLTTGNYVDLLPAAKYIVAKPINSPRHRIRNNLLGMPGFCPVIRRTDQIAEAIGNRWNEKAKDIIGRVSPSVIARAASFMLLADSQASYQIEGERPPRNRLERWMRAAAQAGRQPVTIDELVRLQHIVIEDGAYVEHGLRQEGGFIGGRDYDQNPMPEFISARHDDLAGLLQGLMAAHQRMSDGNVDAVLQAAVIAFGFVFIHPFEDGNGRIHRYLINHVLAERKFTPAGMTFPVSTVLLKRIEAYQDVLRQFTGPLLQYIEWVPTASRNVHIINDTADLYRYGDFTAIAEFLYACVIATIAEDLPREIGYLKKYDVAKRRIEDMMDIADKDISLLIVSIARNHGRLSKSRRSKDFARMTDEQLAQVERIIADAYEDD